MRVEWHGQSAFTQAARVVEELGPRWVVPMHYRTPRIGFLETEEEFIEEERTPRPSQSGYSSLRQARGSSGCGFGVRSSRKL
jgi:hypothetical protein